jgi:hypothetical protein
VGVVGDCERRVGRNERVGWWGERRAASGAVKLDPVSSAAEALEAWTEGAKVQIYR